MGIEVGGIGEGDLFPWVDLYAQYARSHGRDLSDRDALRVWSWITGPEPEGHGLLATEDGTAIGLLHFHVHPRPLNAGYAIQIDDLYAAVDDDTTDVTQALIGAVEEWAAEHHIVAITRPGEDPDPTSAPSTTPAGSA